jgi:hypothetical protein
MDVMLLNNLSNVGHSLTNYIIPMINLQRKMDMILLSSEARLCDCYFYYSAIAKQPTLKYKLK